MAIKTVLAGQSLQSAIDTAQLGDTINVEGTFVGPIELPAKTGTGEIVIQSSRVTELPQGRVNSSHSGVMPKIICPNFDQAIKTKPGAHHYRLDGIEVLPNSNVIEIYDLVRFGGGRNDQKTLDSVPHHLKMDRCYIHGFPATTFMQRGLTLNSTDTEVTRSCFSEIHAHGMDTQAICSWNTPGRNKILDNYLEAGSENILLGGADPYSVDFIPSDYQILRNHCFKPLTWKGAGWNVKNLLELKNARNVLIDGNIFENNWTDGQAGIPILFTVRNQEGTAPFSIITNVVFSNNTVKNAEGALNLLGTDNEKPSQRCSGLIIRNNVFDKIVGPFLTMNGYYNVTIERNTHLQTCTSGCNTMTLYGQQSTGFIYRDNVTIEKPYGVFGDGGLIGTAALEKWTPGYVFTGNVLANPYGGNVYPAGNEYPPSLTVAPDYRTSYTGKGADIDQLLAAQSGAASPPPIDPPPPPIDPVPTTPAIGSLKKDVPWNATEGTENAEAKRQRSLGYYFYSHQSGKKATFVYTGVKLS
jgi:hypothetical protein